MYPALHFEDEEVRPQEGKGLTSKMKGRLFSGDPRVRM